MIPCETDNQYCFINVGRAAGKVKFCMLDKRLSWIGDKYHLRAVLMTNRNTGDVTTQVLALLKVHMASDGAADIGQVTTIQHIIWEAAYGQKTWFNPGQTISHINLNTMDNRLSNLILTDELCDRKSVDNSYSSCLQQIVSALPWMNIPEVVHIPSAEEKFSSQLFDKLANQHPLHPSLSDQMWSSLQTDKLDRTRPVTDYTECHYLPCTRLELRPQHFDCCGACHSVKYCSLECQKLDWTTHSLHCDLLDSINNQQSMEGHQPSHRLNHNQKLTLVYDIPPYALEQTIIYKDNWDDESSHNIDR